MNANMNGGTLAPKMNSGSSPHSHSSASSHRPSNHFTSGKSSDSAQNSSQQGTSSASIPINLYRELTAELQQTQEQLRTMGDRNETLAQHNQQLRAEISQLVRAVLQARYAANALQPDAPIMPELDAALNQGGANPEAPKQAQNHSLEDALAAALNQQASMMPPGTASSPANHSDASSLADALLIQSGAKGSIKMPSHPRPMGTTQSHASHSPNLHEKETTPVFRGWGIVAIVMMVVVAGFGMGFATTLWLQHRSGSTSQ